MGHKRKYSKLVSELKDITKYRNIAYLFIYQPSKHRKQKQKVVFYPTEELLPGKGSNQQSKETANRMEENICKLNI